MERLVTFERARRQLLGHCDALADTERVALANAAGRRLAENCVANEPRPVRALAAADGLAVSSADSVGASPYNPLPAAGASPVEPGDALPGGADAVAPWESVTADGGGWTLLTEIDAGQGVCRSGQLLAAGDVALTAGRCLHAADVALLAWLGHSEAQVYRRPAVELIFTREDASGGAVDLVLAPLLAADGAEIRRGQATTQEALASTLSAAAARADVVLVLGGTAEGPSGIAPGALARVGSLYAHGLGMRPGRAAGLGAVAECPVLLVPPEPVAARAVCELLAGPALRSLAGAGSKWPHRTVRAPLARKAVSTLGELGYLRAAFDGERIAPRPTGTDLDLPTLSRTDGFVLVAPESEGHAPGTEVTLYRDRC